MLYHFSAWHGIEQADDYTEAESTPSAAGVPAQISPWNQSMISDHEYLYWMTGATAAGLVWACINVVTLILLNELIRTHLALLAKLEKIIIEE